MTQLWGASAAVPRRAGWSGVCDRRRYHGGVLMQNGPNSSAGAAADWQPPNSADSPARISLRCPSGRLPLPPQTPRESHTAAVPPGQVLASLTPYILSERVNTELFSSNMKHSADVVNCRSKFILHHVRMTALLNITIWQNSCFVSQYNKFRMV